MRPLAVLLLAAAALLPAGPARAQTQTEDDDTSRLRQNYAQLLQKKLLLERERQLKALQLTLAEDDAPYLVVDLQAPALRIFVRVIEVRRYPLLEVELEGERGLFAASGPPPDWVNRTYTLAAKSGPAREPEKIAPPAQGERRDDVDPRSVTPDKIGLDKEPEYPERYTLLFQEGLALSLGGATLRPEEKTWVRRKLERLMSLVVPPEMPDAPGMGPARVWIHGRMPAAETQALYPSLFTGMRAMVRLPGDPPL